VSCREASRISLATLGGHAADAQRLQLEEHLTTCERCGEQHRTSLGMVRRLGELEPEALTTAAHEVVRRAVAAGQPARRSARRRRTPSLVPLPLRAAVVVGAVGLVAAVAAILGGAFLWRDRADRPYRVIAGDVAVERSVGGASDRSSVGAEPPALLVRSVTGGRVRLSNATIDLGSATELLWDGHQRVVDLRSGRLTVDVEHQVGRRLRIRTERFTVEVVGTRFAVDASGVRTERGLVRVTRPDGSLIAWVEAGATWSTAALVARMPSPAGTPHEPLALTRVGLEPTRSGARHHVAMEPRGPAEHTPDPGAVAPAAAGGAANGAFDELRAARRALARGDAQATRDKVEPLFRLGREVAVEARVVFAESFLLEGRYADAIDAYRLVARDFPTTNQAEISQFAIAQLEADHGQATQARAALQAYLGRYPRGRFVKDAAERLAQLGSREP